MEEGYVQSFSLRRRKAVVLIKRKGWWARLPNTGNERRIVDFPRDFTTEHLKKGDHVLILWPRDIVRLSDGRQEGHLFFGRDSPAEHSEGGGISVSKYIGECSVAYPRTF
ncbi:MAG: hypothetical protein WD153_01440 [Candidatus Paceibacterota bacterium]